MAGGGCDDEGEGFGLSLGFGAMDFLVCKRFKRDKLACQTDERKKNGDGGSGGGWRELWRWDAYLRFVLSRAPSSLPQVPLCLLGILPHGSGNTRSTHH